MSVISSRLNKCYSFQLSDKSTCSLSISSEEEQSPRFSSCQTLPLPISFSHSNHKFHHSFNNSYTQPSLFKAISPLKKKKSQEDSLREMFFSPKNTLLYCFCDSLLKHDVNVSYIGCLINYYASRGKVIELLEAIAFKEIDETSYCNELFRGNTPFTRIFNSYTFKFCDELLKEEFKIYGDIHINQTERILKEGIWVDKMSTSKNIIHLLTKFVNKCPSYIPPHFKTILRKIYHRVAQSRSKTEARNTFLTLFFLRYCFRPFSKVPSVLKILHEAVHRCSQESKYSTDSNNIELRTAINSLLSYITNTPDESSYGLINRAMQEISLEQMVNIFKTEMGTISKFYDGDFNEIFNIVKGKYDGIHSINPEMAVSRLNTWEEEKLTLASQLNNELKQQIEKLKRYNKILKNRINTLAALCN
ncbi:hypothetical protein ENUP19_0305G0090 [Entamoeba nuttalli]|uniref:GTPase-activator protein for Ras family GTPase n=2 Tax=Entamoeba nuttalli TaxID=412467 RepID=K2HCY4_ENTNP|nr:GTPase-activator protein for Ras family GTPase [Entamoeba nuttalli P19]EKE40599.1 GTPase-activator protein for Ras family GTPase [Entamoeba nuttalli P19]|eukprot:XP_008857075.1 GTPase-activator protein for Ras family GTPase [Entamoeba nuttalli P19]